MNIQMRLGFPVPRPNKITEKSEEAEGDGIMAFHSVLKGTALSVLVFISVNRVSLTWRGNLWSVFKFNKHK